MGSPHFCADVRLDMRPPQAQHCEAGEAQEWRSEARLIAPCRRDFHPDPRPTTPCRNCSSFKSTFSDGYLRPNHMTSGAMSPGSGLARSASSRRARGTDFRPTLCKGTTCHKHVESNDIPTVPDPGGMSGTPENSELRGRSNPEANFRRPQILGETSGAVFVQNPEAFATSGCEGNFVVGAAGERHGEMHRYCTATSNRSTLRLPDLVGCPELQKL